MEGVLRDNLNAAQDDRRVPGLPYAFRHHTVPLLHPHHQLPLQRVLGWVRFNVVMFYFCLSSAYSFASCVGQFVLTASLRSQVNPANRNEFKEVSPERYVVDSIHESRILILYRGPQSLCGLRARLDRTTLLRVQLPRMTARMARGRGSCWVVEGAVVRVHG